MELYLEFLFTVVLSILIAFLIGTIFSGLDADADRRLEPSSKIGDDGTDPPLSSDTIDLDQNNEKNEQKMMNDDTHIERFDDDDYDDEEEERNEVRSSGLDNLGKVAEVARVRVSESSLEVVRESGYLGDESRVSVGGSTTGEICGSSSEKEEGFVGESECLEGSGAVRIETAVKVEGNECGDNVIRSTEENSVGKEGFEGKESGDGEMERLDDWEGIELTEVEEHFREAAAYVGGEGGEFALSSLSGDEQMRLYGLHKMATEGQCYDPQPMALNVSARARWHAWQRLGCMNPDVAMEQYINLLSEKAPGWMRDKLKGDAGEHEPRELEAAISGTSQSGLCLNIHNQLNPENERKPDGSSCIDEKI